MKTESLPLKLLLVDDNEPFRAALGRILEEAGYAVTLAANGQEAKEVLTLVGFQIVISDIRMSPIDGVELLKFVRESAQVPVILMTGFSDIMEIHEAERVGAAGFLAKPFVPEELLKVVRQALNPIEQAPSLDLDYCKLAIDDFVSGSQIKYDIYVRLSDKKYLKVATSGENLSIERITHYKTKGIRFLFLKKDDFQKYLGFNLTLSKSVNLRTDVSREKKLQLLKHTSEVLLEQLYRNGIDSTSFNFANANVESCLSVISENESLFQMLNVLRTHSEFLYAHSLGVAVYSVMIARELGWSNHQVLFKIALGGILHDIGKREVPAEILSKPREERSSEERNLYESHAQIGAELLAPIKAVPADIIQIVLQHHEHPNGSGFPARLKKEKIHPLARLVGIADQFCNFILTSNPAAAFTPNEAFEHLLSLNGGSEVDGTYLRALGKLIVKPSAVVKGKEAS